LSLLIEMVEQAAQTGETWTVGVEL
jgi:hypothetical protein